MFEHRRKLGGKVFSTTRKLYLPVSFFCQEKIILLPLNISILKKVFRKLLLHNIILKKNIVSNF